uniref:Uncharacterized protein n=1 Tax=Mycena chlorophos TaxID=658473 RepID=A0ABQ0MBY8_MYCCL|nr:predicted protein [Mycena chlorophos]
MTPEEAHKAWISIVQEVVVVPGRRDEVAHPAALDVFLGLNKLIDAMGTKGPDKDRLKFCRHCIAEQKYVFHEMQENWWNSLDEWLNIATLEN